MNTQKHIVRLLIWFKNPDDSLYELTRLFVPVSMLMNRLLNELYSGKKIKFLNINLRTADSFEKIENASIDYVHSYGGHISIDSILPLDKFNSLSYTEQLYFVWDLAKEAILKISTDLKNNDLSDAVQKAYQKGLDQNIDLDFDLIVEEFQIGNHTFVASLKMEFDKNIVHAHYKIVSDSKSIFNQIIDSTTCDTEFFYEMFKSIVTEGNHIVLKGHEEVDYLPLYVEIENQT
ncbi:hypothetical protein K6119_04210 [Paracrocinitomix mangrovi]|uniref:hypothetical protein n=1 Tax=Paracrocinitomix mangrovi TaxID=2862509 RepID=UPI001C8D47F1|nr:hypothetical protein [Paracrocinitomix mangrovi]UKN02717.1 hypothetical protein K6119_04210 [Paracrocinitomix mangrovi]